ncbi:hypothetical protein [Paenibacillus polymyxa]|uniref:hypothetical protein n=1 Tax=Paenibacillus polymyxa TaxID=1406 RepID=UPI002223203B|nr:hypothetical protein [Paenibacillus polymyxa]
MTDKPRNWQEDMNLCQKATPGPWNIVTDDFGEDNVCYVPTELHAQNGTKIISYEGGFVPIHEIWSAEQLHANAQLISESRQALPYWLQEVQKEKERAGQAREWHAAASRDRDAVYKKLEEAESLIQRKDTEIAALKRLAEFWGSQYNDAIKHGNETEERLNVKIAGLTALLQGKGDTP